MNKRERTDWIFEYHRNPSVEFGEDPGRWYLTYESPGGDITPLEDKLLVFRLRAGADKEDARRLTNELNEYLEQVSYMDRSDLQDG